jgi:uncharacterized protein YbaR (Trm112 family)
MDDAFLSLLRCPLDPAREASLGRQGQELICSRCSVRFPMKQGLPVLVPEEGELPAGLREVSQLPCRRAADRARRRN